MADRNMKDDLQFWVRATSTLILMTLCALAMLGVATTTLFQARRFYSERIATPFGRLTLAVWGIRVEVKQPQQFPLTQNAQNHFISYRRSPFVTPKVVPSILPSRQI